ncbi:MAG TPA: YggS family pyridoxal phosphate-dependent enzyme [Woeseiaceae bacterium]|nr:YggS family pyridoxal phosphate-dependent enzyme [Woeseiaceae bacterium]
MIGVTENLRKIRDLLARCAAEADRDPGGITLLAVSKKQPVTRILEAAAAGQRDFGENVVQEALPKIGELAGKGLVWHFIGRLQGNKTRAVATHFDWVHSIDRLRVAERLAEQRPASMPPLNVCLQVNVDNEPGKAGVAAADLAALARGVAALAQLRLRGLMCIPAPRAGTEAQREPFRSLRELAGALADSGIPTDTLSMGMTADYCAAIAEGATIVRIGTAIFGERD